MFELLPLLGSALVLGLLGGGHCLGMCGGLMGALTLAIPAEQRGRRLRLLLAYNLGRVLSYASAGLLLGMAGWAVASSPAAQVLRAIAALLLIAMGLYLAGWWSGLTRIEALGRGLWRHIQPLATRLLPVSSLPRALLLGALWGWLPCGLVYSTLLWAASQGNAGYSAALMLALRLASPFLVYSLIINFAIGLINKLTPQIPVFFIATPFITAGGMLLLYAISDQLLTAFVMAFGTFLKAG